MTTNRHLSRRALLASVPMLAAALAACGSSSSDDSGSSASSTTASGLAANGAAAAGSVAALVQAFYATLGDDLKSSVLQEYSLANAKRWSNLPQALVAGGMGGGNGGRLGVNLGQLSAAQLKALDALVKAATGTKTGLGYAEIQQHLNADDYLSQNGGGTDYGRDNYYVAILGSPQDSGTWEFQYGGHHLAVANTYIDGKLVGATPSFRGIEPNGTFTLNGTTNEPMKVKESALTAMLAGLSDSQLATAKLSDTFSDLVLGAGQDWAFPTGHEGLQVSTLPAAQKQLVLTAIASYVDDLADSDAKTFLAGYEKDLDDTYVAWSGTKALTEQNDYVRIDGPGVWIEFSMQHGIVLSGNHPHSVWRDRTTDYGGTKS